VLSRVPWWLDEAPPDPEAEPLVGDAEADVAIVGAGYTGLWTALELKRRDPAQRVTVLEAEHVGYGPSGRNGGFLETYWCALPRLRSRLGDEAALVLARASEGAIPAVEALGEDVWLRRGGMLEVSTTPAQDAAVEDAIRVAAGLGAPERALPVEPGISPVFRRALGDARDDATALTNVFTGRPARGLVNRALRELGPLSDDAPAFPLAGGALAPLRAAAEAHGSGDFTPLWSGQAARLCRALPAGELTRRLADETLALLTRR